MAFLTYNRIPVLRGTVTLPRIGPWTADVIADAAFNGDEHVTLTLGVDSSIKLEGTVFRGGTTRGAMTARIVGGAGGLGKILPAKGYHGVALRLPLSEALDAAGEKLSDASDAAVLGLNLTAWSRFSATAGNAIAALMHAAPDASWRVLGDGTVWVGVEKWLPTKLGRRVLTKDDPHHGRIELAADVPCIFPGETLNGRKVSMVEHKIEPRSVRATIYFEE